MTSTCNNQKMKRKEHPTSDSQRTPIQPNPLIIVEKNNISHLFHEKCSICDCHLPKAAFMFSNSKRQFTRLCEHNHEKSKAMSEDAKNKAQKEFYMCILCGKISNKADVISNHYLRDDNECSKKYKQKYCIFCKKIVKEADLLSHLASHMRASNLMGKFIPTPILNAEQQSFLNSVSNSNITNDNNSVISSSSSSNIVNLPIIIPSSPSNSNIAPQNTFSESAALNQALNSSEEVWQNYLNLIPQHKQQVVRKNNEKTTIILSESDLEDIENYFLQLTFHMYSKLPIYTTPDPFLEHEKDLYYWLKNYKVPREAFLSLVKILPNSLSKPPKNNERLLSLDTWERTNEITSNFQIPNFWTEYLGAPIYSISDYIRRLAEKTKFWNNLIQGDSNLDQFAVSEERKAILKQFMESERFKKIDQYCKKENAKFLLIDLFLDDFDLERFAKIKSYCGYYCNIANLATPIMSQIEDQFLVSLSKKGIVHNEILQQIFEEMNFLFSGVEIWNPIKKEYEKIIVFLWTIDADSPERCKVTCTLDYSADQGCFNCDMDLNHTNILVQKNVGLKKTIKFHLKTRQAARNLAEEIMKGNKPESHLVTLQKKTGVKAYDLSAKTADKQKIKEAFEKRKEVIPEKPLSSYYQQSPILELTQTQMGFFDFDNVIIVPFHTICLGVMQVIMPWVFEKCSKPRLQSFLDSCKLIPEVKEWTKSEWDVFFEKIDEFTSCINVQEIKVVWEKFGLCIRDLLRSRRIVPFPEYVDAKIEFIKKFEEKWSEAIERPKFHFLDHLVLQIPQTGPLRMKDEVRGEAHHQKVKKCSKNAERKNFVRSTARNRLLEWIINLSQVQ